MNVSFEWNQNGGASTNAEKVQLAGSFTQWQPVEMAKTDEKWCLQLDLAPGEYEFKFVVDGKWIHDEGQASKINEMGSHNNIVIVSKFKKIFKFPILILILLFR
jgi:1,4-alpha-glucan branching enzyme